MAAWSMAEQHRLGGRRALQNGDDSYANTSIGLVSFVTLLGEYLDPFPVRGSSAMPQSVVVSAFGARPPGTSPSP